MIADGLELVDVWERGTPNREAVVLRGREAIALNNFGLLVGYQSEQMAVTPYPDAFFWLGNVDLAVDDWVVVYTGAGEDHVVDHGHSKTYFRFWRRSSTLFANSRIVPILFSFGAIAIGEQPKDRPQLAIEAPSSGSA